MLASGTLSPVASLLLQPHRDRLGDVLNLRLQDPRWTTFRAAVAFVKRSGVIQIGVGARIPRPRCATIDLLAIVATAGE